MAFYGQAPPGFAVPPQPGFAVPLQSGFAAPPQPGHAASPQPGAGLYGPPPPGWYGPRPAPQWDGKTNRLSIAGLITAVLGCLFGVVGLVLGIAGLVQSRRNGDRLGRNLGIAAVAVAGMYLVFIVGLLGSVMYQKATNPERDDTGALNGPRSISVTDLRPGDCIEDLNSQSGSKIDAVPCSLMHSSEVVGVFQLPSGTTDRDAAIDAGCSDHYWMYTGSPAPEDPAAAAQLYWVEVEDGPLAGPDVICFAHEEANVTMGSVRRR
ncbi:hypothetical protein GCM10009828_068890 [Actinoplanes couchii]|uniref:DUF4190 domain-containing protein n=1 Tax=Actinoplanes couchii TaxID=403638 RepID=A0ABQ3X5G0_9ACTN|nr:hypothetical protein Aco03nite_021590 [Actinoplanes couchii]